MVKSMDLESYCVSFNFDSPLICFMSLGKSLNPCLCFLIGKIMCRLFSAALPDPLTTLYHSDLSPGKLTFGDVSPGFQLDLASKGHWQDMGGWKERCLGTYSSPFRPWGNTVVLFQATALLIASDLAGFWNLLFQLRAGSSSPLWLAPGAASSILFL